MTSTTTDRPAPSRAAPSRRVLLVAAVIAVVAAVSVGWALTRPERSNAPQATASASATAGTGQITMLTLTAVRAKCREPEPALLAQAADFAFAGTVTGISGNVVSLHVTRVYQGAAADSVEVAQTGDSSETMLGSGKFETGKAYLVAAAQGAVMICGYSGEADLPGLSELYAKAF